MLWSASVETSRFTFVAVLWKEISLRRRTFRAECGIKLAPFWVTWQDRYGVLIGLISSCAVFENDPFAL